MIYGNDLLQRKIDGTAYKADNGDWVEGESSWSEPLQCDAFPSAGKADLIAFPDGHRDVYAYEIHMDVDVDDFSVGDQVRINIKGHCAEFIVKGFHRYAYNAKLWV